MQKITTILALVLLTAMPVMAERVTPEKARKAATTFLNNNGAKTAQLTDLTKAAGFPNLYIFTAEQGFVVMAADDCVQPILGYSLTNPATAIVPDNVRGWLQGYDNEIQYAIDSKAKATTETTQQWQDLLSGNAKAGQATTVVAPLLQTQWNQNGRYFGGSFVMLFNNLCPQIPSGGSGGRAVTGCVATAMAQIMKYYNYPSKGMGSHSYTWNNQTLSADFGNTTYEWNNMTNTYSNTSTTTQKNAVAVLMYHCGVSVEMSYGSSSSASTYAVVNALKTYFNYNPDMEYKNKSSFTDEQWTQMVIDELEANRPLQYRGSTGTGGGHSFVCDGYDSNNKFHFNWGWAGAYDGYFYLSNLNTGANNQTGQGNGDYTNDQAAIFGIRPSNNDSAPSNLTYTMVGLQGLTLNWTTASGAASYNVYRNGNLAGNVTGTTYSETAPFGTNEYYVRSVDANGELSLPSNTVSVSVAYQHPVVNDLSATLSGNNAVLNWTAPDWCYPETPSATLTYGDGNYYNSSSTKFWAHRYLGANLEQYSDKTIYKISFFVHSESGTYNCFIYKGTINRVSGGEDVCVPQTLLMEKTIEVTGTQTWIEMDLSNPVSIDGDDDIWVIINYPDNGNGNYAASFCNYSNSDNHGNYWGRWTYGDGSKGYVQNDGRAYLIKTYLTDGVYTYNIYDGSTKLNGNTPVADTTYTVQNLANGNHQYTVKTNYYAGETNASNKASIAKGTVSVASLEMAANDMMTVTEGSKLTVNGTLSNANPENLILEKGAQLVHNSEGVKATVKKVINPYNGDDQGWNFIASPVIESIEPSEDNGLLSGNYDLYLYEEPTHMWRNHKEHIVDGNNQNAASGFHLNHKQGYLYANSTSNTLQFAGTLTPSNSTVSISNLSHSASTLTGFNLVGNPYAHNVTSYTRNNVVEECYRLNANGSDILPSTIDEDNPLLPAEGFFVKATNANASITFNGQTRGDNASSTSSGAIQIDLTQNGLTLDRFIVKRDGEPLEKLTLNENSPIIYATHNGQDMAVVTTEGIEQTIQLKASKDDTYTLSARMKNMDLAYLHLIDNITGADVDLLQTPEYTFNASATDYASRFKLVFFANGDIDGSNDSFAFHSNGNWIIINDGEATLQVVDLMGRIISNERINGSCNKSIDAPAGVYLLRLVCGKDIKTQKVVIE